MLLEYLSKPVQLAGVKLCNVSLGDFQTDAINVMLQKRKQKGWHTSKGRNENNPIISYRGACGNFRLLGSSRDDSWYLKHVNDPWGRNVARKRKNTNNKAERQRESISQAVKKKNPFLLPRASNEYVRIDSFFSIMSQFSAGPEELWSNNVISRQLVPTVGQAVHGKREAGLFKAGQGSQNISEEPWHSRRPKHSNP